jgi:hypothetical protein
MKISKMLLSAIAILTFVATANTSFAQSTTVQATGTVLEPISFTNSTNLAFGASLFPGISKTVAITGSGAASIDVDGEASKEVTVTWTLPTELTHTTDGTSTMPVSFGTTDAGYNTADDPSLATTYDPSTVLTTTLGTTSGLLYLWLGGTVSPAANQTAGAYAADITVDVAYTGN